MIRLRRGKLLAWGAASSGNSETLGNHRLRQPTVALWIKIFQAGAEHADRASANVQRGLMRGGVDAQGQAAGDDKAGSGQAARERRRRVHARARCASTAHHRQLRFFQDQGVASDKQQRRWITDLCEQRRVFRLVPHQ
jgi:hypothetical protein